MCICTYMVMYVFAIVSCSQCVDAHSSDSAGLTRKREAGMEVY